MYILNVRMPQSCTLLRHSTNVYCIIYNITLQVFATYQDDHPLGEEELLGSKITVSIAIAGDNTQVGVGAVVL